MMKNKKALYVLVPVVLFVWGMIIYKIVSGLRGDDVESNTYASVPLIDMSQAEVQDTFELILEYRDPFLKKRRIPIKSAKAGAGEKKIVQPRKDKKEETWPTIVYAGMIKNKNSLQKVGLIRIDQNDHLLKEREIVDELKILKITHDSIIVSNGKNRKVVYQ